MQLQNVKFKILYGVDIIEVAKFGKSAQTHPGIPATPDPPAVWRSPRSLINRIFGNTYEYEYEYDYHWNANGVWEPCQTFSAHILPQG